MKNLQELRETEVREATRVLSGEAPIRTSGPSGATEEVDKREKTTEGAEEDDGRSSVLDKTLLLPMDPGMVAETTAVNSGPVAETTAALIRVVAGG